MYQWELHHVHYVLGQHVHFKLIANRKGILKPDDVTFVTILFWKNRKKKTEHLRFFLSLRGPKRHRTTHSQPPSSIQENFQKLGPPTHPEIIKKNPTIPNRRVRHFTAEKKKVE